MILLLSLCSAAERAFPEEATAAELAVAFAAGDSVRVGAVVLPPVAPTAVPLGSPDTAPDLWEKRPLVMWLAPGDWRLGWWPNDDFAVGHDVRLLERVLGELRKLTPTGNALHIEVRPDTPAGEVATVLHAVGSRGFAAPLDLVVTAPAWTPESAAHLPDAPHKAPLRSSVARPTDSGAFVFENVRGVGGLHTVEADDVLGFREDCHGGYCVLVLVAPEADYLVHIRAQSDALTHRWIRNLPVAPWEGRSLARAVTPRFDGALEPFLAPAETRQATEKHTGYFYTDAAVDRSVLAAREDMLRRRCAGALDLRGYLRWALGALGQDGIVEFTFSVAGDGTLLDTETRHGVVRNLPLEQCVPRAMRRIGFPKSVDGAPYEVEYGVHFSVD